MVNVCSVLRAEKPILIPTAKQHRHKVNPISYRFIAFSRYTATTNPVAILYCEVTTKH